MPIKEHVHVRINIHGSAAECPGNDDLILMQTNDGFNKHIFHKAYVQSGQIQSELQRHNLA
jgi:hypothetical protein